jgi:hypothetical protein
MSSFEANLMSYYVRNTLGFRKICKYVRRMRPFETRKLRVTPGETGE